MIYPTVNCLFRDYILIFKDSIGNHMGICPSPSSVGLIEKHSTSFLGLKIMRTVITEDIDSMFKTLRTRGVSVSVLIRLRRALHQMFELALIQGIVRYNPVEGAMRFHTDTSRIRYYSDSQCRSIFGAIRQVSYSGIFNTIMMTGMPFSAAAALSYDRLDFDRHVILVSQHYDYRNVDSALVYGMPNGVDYSVDMPDELETVLKSELRMQERCCRTRYGFWSNKDRLVFTDGFGGPVNYRNVRSEYARIRKISGVGDFCMRTMRSNYLMSSMLYGKHLPEAARQAGFADIGSVMPYFFEAKKFIDAQRLTEEAAHVGVC